MICYGFLFIFQCQQPAPPPSILVCQTVTTWTRTYQAKLADELQRLRDDSATMKALREHIRLRDQLRRCRVKR
jgi:hypothetical protein